MVANQSLWLYFFNAGPVVKIVMLLLLTASILSWTFIIQRWFFLQRAFSGSERFQQKFWSGVNLSKFYSELTVKRSIDDGLAHIFTAGYKEFVRLIQSGADEDMVLAGAQRAMRIANAREASRLEQHLPFLASVGSTSPYIGLFGTVWGIMTAFHALGNVQQATIAMVAPGISEALVATAMGLFAAIPAVLAYNRYSSQVDTLLNEYETFQEELASVLQRQLGAQHG